MCLGRHGKRGSHAQGQTPLRRVQGEAGARVAAGRQDRRRGRRRARPQPQPGQEPEGEGRVRPVARVLRRGGRAVGSSRGTGRRSTTCIAGSARSPPSAAVFNGACLSAAASTSRTCLVDPGNAEVPVARQCRLLGIPRSSHCYRPRRRRLVAGLMKKMSVRPV